MLSLYYSALTSVALRLDPQFINWESLVRQKLDARYDKTGHLKRYYEHFLKIIICLSSACFERDNREYFNFR